jgi:hypothetical protein
MVFFTFVLRRALGALRGPNGPSSRSAYPRGRQTAQSRRANASDLGRRVGMPLRHLEGGQMDPHAPAGPQTERLVHRNTSAPQIGKPTRRCG